MRTMSPSFSSRLFMTSGSSRTIPRPASAGFASATRRNFSRAADMVGTVPAAPDRTGDPGGRSQRIGVTWTHVKTPGGIEKGRNGCRLPDGHLDRLRRGGRLLLTHPDVEHAVLQVRCRQAGVAPCWG